MPVRCRSGKARYRFKKIKGGKERLAFCGNKVREVKVYKKNRIELVRVPYGSKRTPKSRREYRTGSGAVGTTKEFKSFFKGSKLRKRRGKDMYDLFLPRF